LDEDQDDLDEEEDDLDEDVYSVSIICMQVMTGHYRPHRSAPHCTITGHTTLLCTAPLTPQIRPLSALIHWSAQIHWPHSIQAYHFITPYREFLSLIIHESICYFIRNMKTFNTCRIILHSITFQSALHGIALYGIVLHGIALYGIVLYGIA
jgi:hypothetical protein